MLTLTENARTTVQELAENAELPKSGGLRIAASQSERGGFDLALVAEPSPGDAVVDAGHTKIYLEPTASAALADQELDADPGDVEGGFTVVKQG